MSSTTGRLFTLTTFGESHGPAIGGVVDGCPARIALSEGDIQPQLDRRRPGQSSLTTARQEKDRIRLLSGVDKGITLGSPIAFAIENQDPQPGDYARLAGIPRPSHADFTYRIKYGISAASGGGRSSARETVARVAGGAIAEKFLKDRFGVSVVAWVSAVARVSAPELSERALTRSEVDATAVRCPDPDAATEMEGEIRRAAAEGDSVGGVITCVCRGVPAGWGEPVFDKVKSALAAAALSIPAASGFEMGAGFAGARMRGSEHNDLFAMKGDRLGTVTNRSGGVQGGITNGEPVVFRVAFKPVATIRRPQQTADYNGSAVSLEAAGRHDPCVLPRAVPVVEAMAALVLADMARMAAG